MTLYKTAMFFIILIIIVALLLYINYINHIDYPEYFCENKTLTDCLNTSNCKFVLNEKGGCTEITNKNPLVKSTAFINSPIQTRQLFNDSFTRAFIANDDNYRNINNGIFI